MEPKMIATSHVTLQKELVVMKAPITVTRTVGSARIITFSKCKRKDRATVHVIGVTLEEKLVKEFYQNPHRACNLVPLIQILPVGLLGETDNVLVRKFT
jgi:hypothetical protein